MFLKKGVLKICSKFTGEHPYRSVISIKLQSSFIETPLRHGCSLVNLLHIFRAPFPKSPLECCFCRSNLIQYMLLLSSHGPVPSEISNKNILKKNIKVSFFGSPWLSFTNFGSLGIFYKDVMCTALPSALTLFKNLTNLAKRFPEKTQGSFLGQVWPVLPWYWTENKIEWNKICFIL